MTISQLVGLTLYALGMAFGQFLFKSAADRYAMTEAHTLSDHVVRFLKLALDPLFVIAIVLYMSLSIFWVWMLSFTPLSRAYPFGALAFVFTLVIAVLFFRETVTRTHLIGLACILSGILIISRG